MVYTYLEVGGQMKLAYKDQRTLTISRTGEFSSPKQGTFYHYNDFWHLDPSTREWTRLETKGKGPPARSGHRMTYFKVGFKSSWLAGDMLIV